MRVSPGLALGALLFAATPAQIASGQSNVLDTTTGALDLQAQKLIAGDNEKNVARKMGRPPDAIEEAKCETPPQDCKIFEYRDAETSVFVYFTRSTRKPEGWRVRGFYRQGFWRPLSPAEVIK
jgi:hypothetical protein